MKLAALLLAVPALALAQIPPAALQYRGVLIREAHFQFGLDAPVDVLAGQIQQESGWRAGVTAWDNGRGLVQMMDGTGKWLTDRYPDLGEPAPYNPLWAIRAMVRLDAHNLERVKAVTDCDRWGAALKGYNAGLGFVLRAQKRAEIPGLWFGKFATEWINAGQSSKNFEASRLYPRWIIGRHAPRFAGWGRGVDCEGRL
ncbi:MAG: transglycosylase SLT domain-containing protein [Burkholderiales bacterium]